MMSAGLMASLMWSGAAYAMNDKVVEQPDWAVFFEKAGVTGTIVLKLSNEAVHRAYNTKRAVEGKIPASTFKIVNTMIAYETDVVRDTEKVFKWDGKEQDFKSWNKDMTLRTAIAKSAVPAYRRIATSIGEKRMASWLKKLNYGNASIEGGIENFWLTGGLRISALEQISLLENLYADKLPISKKAQAFVRDILPEMKTECFVIKAKTGWAYHLPAPQMGWWVGRVEAKGETTFFALNIDIKSKADLKWRKAIVLNVLRKQGVIPADKCL